MISLTRLDKWEDRLSQYISSVRDTPFVWGAHDCCIFAADAIQAMTGIDLMPEERGCYDSSTSAMLLLKRQGFASAEQKLDSLLEVIPIGRAHRGDIALAYDNAGVVAGDFAWMIDDDGLVRIPRAEWSRAWKVGR